MGTSYTSFGSEGFWSRDSGIELWLLLLVRELETWPERPIWLDDAIAHWRTQATAGFNGCVDADLDRICTSQDRIDLLVAASNAVVAWLRAQAPILPKDLLNSFGLSGPGSYFTQDIAVDYPQRIGTAFIELLLGRIAAPPAGGMNFIGYD
jgi:hypothetical protein